jgi:hypothetical protein
MTDFHEHSTVLLAPATPQPQPVRPVRGGRPRRFVVVAILAALAVMVGALGPWAYAAVTGSGSAKDRIA